MTLNWLVSRNDQTKTRKKYFIRYWLLVNGHVLVENVTRYIPIRNSMYNIYYYQPVMFSRVVLVFVPSAHVVAVKVNRPNYT